MTTKKLLPASLATAAAALALAAPAGAEVFCAETPAPCDPAGGVHKGSLAQALADAAVVGGKDKIVLGAKTYSTPSGFLYDVVSETNGVEIVGQGTSTVVQASAPVANGFRVLRVHAPNSVVRNLRVVVPQSSGSLPTVGISLNRGADAEQVDVVDDSVPAGADIGIRAYPGSTVKGVDIAMNDYINAVGVQALDGAVTVTGSEITAGTAVRSEMGGDVTVDTARLDARRGVFATGGAATIVNSLLMMKAGSSVGLQATAATDRDSSLTASHVTVVTKTSNNLGVMSSSTSAYAASILFENSVLVGPHQTALQRFAIGKPASADLVARSSSYTGQVLFGTGTGALKEEDHVGGAPLLVDPINGDVRPMAGSPLVDRAPATAFLAPVAKDIYGTDRAFDGDKDGKKEADVGAAEFFVPPPNPPVTPVAPEPTDDEQPGAQQPQGPGQVDSPSGGTTQQQEQQQEPVRPDGGPFLPQADRTAPAFTSLKLVRTGKRVRFTLGEPARVTLKVQRRVGRKWRTLRTLTVDAGTVRTDVKLGRVKLGTGRRVLASAVDAAGNTSASRTLSLR